MDTQSSKDDRFFPSTILQKIHAARSYLSLKCNKLSGARSQPPGGEWDFNYAADMALYEVKKRGKDMSLLIHEIDDLNNPDIEVMKVEQ